jgi:hypothetical protein
VQDNWKATPRLLLSAGLRWDPFFPYTDSEGRVACFVPGAQSVRFPNAPVGMLFGGKITIQDARNHPFITIRKTSDPGWASLIGLQKTAIRVFAAEPVITTRLRTQLPSRMWLAFRRLLLLSTWPPAGLM